MELLDLSGVWRYDTDPENTGIEKQFFKRKLKGESFMLPSSSCENKVGGKLKKYENLNSESVKCLRERYQYIGALWVQREIYVPPSFAGKAVTLFLERVNMSSMVWVDGERIGREMIELSAPHEYDLTDRLSVGVHTLTIRLDNSNLLNIHTMASGYSDDTQGFWCGIIGRMELRAEDKTRIAALHIFPHKTGFDVKAVITGTCAAPNDRQIVSITLSPTAPDGRELRSDTHYITLYTSRQTVRLSYEFDEPIKYWDEFHPDLYTLRASLMHDDGENKILAKFGMRTIEVKNKQLTLNGKEISLRGTLDCGIYPKTGYPPTDLETWLDTMKTIKSYGLNHVRFHAWCPPEAAFEAADMVGIYVLAEMPLWLNYDVCPLETGDDPIHKFYYHNEAMTISKTYGNHPSFIMFSNGNELLGDFEMLEDITTQIKALDDRRLYTLTSNFDRPVTAADDYFCAAAANGHRIRMQTFFDTISEHTRLSYDDAVKEMPVPIVSFEVGQYCVYPNVDSISDYDGNMAPVNFEAIKTDMIRHGIYNKLEKYIKASGMLAALLYKEDIECALRTRGMGGFELLGLTDYTGQSTATIGLLDVFWKNKGIISREDFTKFCDHTVPLMKTDRVFRSDDIFRAELELYDYSESPVSDPAFTLEMYDGSTLMHREQLNGGRTEFPLDFIKKPSKIKTVLKACGHENSWDIFVYPPIGEYPDLKIIEGNSKALKDIIKNGGKAVVSGKRLKKPHQGYFRPVFWSPAFFKTDRSCGIICDTEHPVFDSFPTDAHADFQWKHPLNNSVGADLTDFPRDFETIIETVPNFYDNTPSSPLFEARIGNADILFCGFDLDAEHKCVQQLRYSIARYAASDKFAPKQTLEPEIFLKLFK